MWLFLLIYAVIFIFMTCILDPLYATRRGSNHWRDNLWQKDEILAAKIQKFLAVRLLITLLCAVCVTIISWYTPWQLLD